ncbi:nuclease A inhibitor family protein [Pontibacter toksunensis]|uniref:Nuclease A inhibitor family protein n=1 Tax=Pontibacter toksunensis TaxID=1332631 RepID=A0ABW6BVJ6_9BACT
MNNQNIPETTYLLQQLRTASEGLAYVSETDHPFEVVHLPDVKDSNSLPSALKNMAALPEDEKVETVELPYFFRNLTRDEPEAGEEENNTARRFRKLQELLEQNLQEVKVYRMGKRRIKAYILGRTGAGDFAGLQTMLVET